MGFALTPGEAPLHFSRSKNVMHVDHRGGRMAARYRFCREYVDKETPSMSVDIPTFMLGVFIYEALSLQQTAICELPDVPL